MLTTMQVTNAGPGSKLGPGKHSDGRAGLSLIVKAGGSKSWVVRFKDRDGVRRDKGVGGFPKVTLAQARRIAESIQADGAPAPAAEPAPVTFRQVARDVLAQNRQVWTSPRQAPDWQGRIENYCGPLLDLPVASITRAQVADALLPIWNSKQSTARRVRQTIRQVLAHAMTYDETILSNAAGDALDGVLRRQAPSKAHHRATCHSEVAEALAIIERCPSHLATRQCLRFVVLTAVRSGEARGARWAEIDGDTWTVPAERTKTREAHRVPLSRQALDVLAEARQLDDGSGLVFPTPRLTGEPLSRFVLNKVLADNAIGSTVHGYRSAFRTWALDTGQDWAASELALAHKLGGQVVQAYVRDADLLEARRPLMQDWADFVAPAAVR